MFYKGECFVIYHGQPLLTAQGGGQEELCKGKPWVALLGSSPSPEMVPWLPGWRRHCCLHMSHPIPAAKIPINSCQGTGEGKARDTPDLQLPRQDLKPTRPFVLKSSSVGPKNEYLILTKATWSYLSLSLSLLCSPLPTPPPHGKCFFLS